MSKVANLQQEAMDLLSDNFEGRNLKEVFDILTYAFLHCLSHAQNLDELQGTLNAIVENLEHGCTVLESRLKEKTQ